MCKKKVRTMVLSYNLILFLKLHKLITRVIREMLPVGHKTKAIMCCVLTITFGTTILINFVVPL